MVVGAFFVISGYVAAYTTTELGQCLEGKPQANTACCWTKEKWLQNPNLRMPTGTVSFLLGNNFFRELRRFFFGVPLFGSSPKTEAKRLQKTGQCVSWGELRPALWVFWIPQGCTKTMLHIIKGIETRHPTGKLSSCTSWVSFQVEKVSNNWIWFCALKKTEPTLLNLIAMFLQILFFDQILFLFPITFHISSESSFPSFYLWWHLHSALMFYESTW